MTFEKVGISMKGVKQLYRCSECKEGLLTRKTHQCIFIDKCQYCRKTILGINKQPEDFCNQICKEQALKEYRKEEALVGNL